MKRRRIRGRTTSPTLTDAELRLMEVLWERGACTVLEVQAALGIERADSTIRTMLGILEGKGYARREKAGRAYVYEPAVGRGETRASVIDYVVTRFFRTPAELMLSILDSEELDERELARIKRAIERRESS
jgi:predicted transcriptional regulator